MAEQRPLHKNFSLAWLDFFENNPFLVEVEKDLSVKKQLLDLVFVRQGPGALSQPPPDGFEDLATYNLVTFKSHQEPLNVAALQELVAHYVNYRKQVSPSMDDPLPAQDFRLYAVCVRFPEQLSSEVALQLIREGVYEVHGLGLRIRIIVVHQLPETQPNAMLQMFSVRGSQLSYAQQHYRPRSLQVSTLLRNLIKIYGEDPTMHELIAKANREAMEEILREAPPEELRKHLSPEERVEGLSPEERLKGLTPEQLRALKEAIQRLEANGSSPKPP